MQSRFLGRLPSPPCLRRLESWDTYAPHETSEAKRERLPHHPDPPQTPMATHWARMTEARPVIVSFCQDQRFGPRLAGPAARMADPSPMDVTPPSIGVDMSLLLWKRCRSYVADERKLQSEACELFLTIRGAGTTRELTIAFLLQVFLPLPSIPFLHLNSLTHSSRFMRFRH